jgi:hypothetical protein
MSASAAIRPAASEAGMVSRGPRKAWRGDISRGPRQGRASVDRLWHALLSAGGSAAGTGAAITGDRPLPFWWRCPLPFA